MLAKTTYIHNWSQHGKYSYQTKTSKLGFFPISTSSQTEHSSDSLRRNSEPWYTAHINLSTFSKQIQSLAFMGEDGQNQGELNLWKR